ncbi:MAG: mandelate racemase/muconate lactonizing enzyme family protein [Cognatishimia sp.]
MSHDKKGTKNISSAPLSFSRSLTIEKIETFPLSASEGVSPHMVLGDMPVRPALLLRITDQDGCCGWGEIWANFPPRANLHKAHLVADVIAPIIEGFTFVEPQEIAEFLRKKLSTYFLHIGQKEVFEHILSGLDIAGWDIALRSASRSFSQHFALTDAHANVYASSINQADLFPKLEHHKSLGQRCFKLKIGFDAATDQAFVAKAASLCPPGSKIAIDSNQAWNLESAKAHHAKLEQYNIQFSEEPIPADRPKSEWEELASATSIPLAAGENIYGIDEFLSMADAGLQIAQPDIAKWGGLSGNLELLAHLPSGVKLWPHFMGSSIGQTAALCIAATSSASTCEMDVNANVLRTELSGPIFQIREGKVALPTSPGLVVPPLPEVLATTFSQ